MDVSVGASAVAVPPPFSPLFVRLLFAMLFLSCAVRDSPRAGFRVFGILSIDLNDASQKGKFHSRIVEQLGWDCFPAA
jgi:hypothetical protein